MAEIFIHALKLHIELIDATLAGLEELRDKAKDELSEGQFINAIKEIKSTREKFLLELRVLERVN